MIKESATNQRAPSYLKPHDRYLICVGTFLEWFEYSLFGFFIGSIAKAFIPLQSLFWQHTLGWLFFACGLVSRFIGVYFFNHAYHRFGKKYSLILSLNLMALSTTAIGLLPTYDSIGILAPFFLLFFRIIQGISMSGEFLSATLLLYEWTPKQQRTLYPPLIAASSCLGIALSAFMAKLIVSLSMPASLKWRLPFIIGGSVSLLAWHIRKELPDIERQPGVKHAPLDSWKALLDQSCQPTFLPVFFIASSLCANSYLSQAYYMSYSSRLGLETDWAFNLQILGQLVMFSSIISMRYFLTVRSVLWHLRFSIILLIPSSFLFFWLSHKLDPGYCLLAQVCFGVSQGYMCSSLLTALCQFFDDPWQRFLGIGLPWSLAVVTFGAFSPNLALLLEASLGMALAPASIIMTVAFITTLILSLFPQRIKKSALLEESSSPL